MLSGIISMPGCDVIPPGYEFAGWLVNASDTPLTYMTDSMENLVEELSEYNIKADVTFTARYREVNLTLYNNQFNGETLYTYDGRTVANVTLFDRWLYKDGSWNTLCLPFSLTETQLAASPLAGGDFRTLSSATFSNGTLTLNFTAEGEVKSLTAGTPYIVKWGDGGLIQDPRFEKMAISYTYNPVETDVVTFSGNFSPVGCSAGDNTMLYLGAGNKLYYPNATMTINSFRAYFQLNNGITAGDPSSPNAIRAFVLNFGDEQTGIAHPDFTDYTDKADDWYSLDGRKLNGKPTQKGIYVVNGKKVVVK